MQLSLFSSGGRLVLGALLLSSLGHAQQLSPYSRQDEPGKGSRQEGEPAPDSAREGAEFVDNPEWLERELQRERQAQLDASRTELEDGDTGSPGYRSELGFSLSPHAPGQASGLPYALAPAFGTPSLGNKFRFDFHGYVAAPLRAGVGERTAALAGQRRLSLHGDPVVTGGAFGWFEHTNTLPVPWSQLNFRVSNGSVAAELVLGAWSLTQSDEAASYFQPPSKLWFDDAWLTLRPDLGLVDIKVLVGVYPDRYGAMGRWDNGIYGAALMFVAVGTGTTATLRVPFENDFTLQVEALAKGDFNHSDPNIVSDASNEFARPIEGATYAAHGHIAVDFFGKLELALHGVHSFSQDDRGDAISGRDTFLGERQRKDRSLTVAGADARFSLQEWGIFILAVRTSGPVIA